MKNRVQLNVSIPFSAADMRDVQNGIRLYRHSNRKLVADYLDALALEMQALAEEMPEVCVRAIRLVGGTVHALDEGQLDALMERIHALFAVEEDAETVGIVSPGFYNRLPVQAMRRFHVQALMDIPSFDRVECQRRGLPYRGALSFDEAREAGVRVFGIRTLCGLSGRTEREWDAALEGICARRPRVVELADAGEEESAAFKEAFCSRLTGQGYIRYAPGGFALEAPISRAVPEGEFLGVGLGALCRYDGFETRSTSDLGAYIAAQGSFDRLCVSMQPVKSIEK